MPNKKLMVIVEKGENILDTGQELPSRTLIMGMGEADRPSTPTKMHHLKAPTAHDRPSQH